MTCVDCETCPAEAPAPAVASPHCQHEVHVTVLPPDGTPASVFLDLVEGLELRGYVMELVAPEGPRPIDFMTSYPVAGSDEAARREMIREADALVLAGLVVVRAKIEAAPWHHRAPTGPGDAMPDGAYWESHVGCWLGPEDVEDVADLLRPTGAYLSVNLLKAPRPNGKVRASVTYRSRTNDKSSQVTEASLMRDLLRHHGVEADASVRTEFTWLDLAEDPARYGGPP